MPHNPTSSVRGPSHVVKRGKTPVLAPDEARQLLDHIDATTAVGLSDRALIGVMVFSFARIGAALRMEVEDAFTQNRGLWLRLHENGGKAHEMPCHHLLKGYLHAYIARCRNTLSHSRYSAIVPLVYNRSIWALPTIRMMKKSEKGRKTPALG